MPLHHVGSERNCNAGITTSRGHCNKAAPPASNSQFLIQPHARSPSVVRTLFWDTRLLQLGIIIASACRHSSIQSIPPVEGTFMVKDESLMEPVGEEVIFPDVILLPLVCWDVSEINTTSTATA